MTKAWQESPRGAALLRERYTSLVNHSWALENHQVFPPGTPPCHRAPSRQGQGIFWRGSTSNCLMSCKIRQVSSGAETWRIPRMDRFPMFSPGILGNFLIVPLFYIFLYYIFLNIYIYICHTHTYIYIDCIYYMILVFWSNHFNHFNPYHQQWGINGDGIDVWTCGFKVIEPPMERWVVTGTVMGWHFTNLSKATSHWFSHWSIQIYPDHSGKLWSMDWFKGKS